MGSVADSGQIKNELHGRVQDITHEIDSIKMGFTYLADEDRTSQVRFSSIEDQLEKWRSRIDLVEQSVQQMSQVVTRMEQQVSPAPTAHGNATATSLTRLSPNIQVPSPIPEFFGNNIQLGSRSIASTVEDLVESLRKDDMPRFDGIRPYSWIARVERFFRLRNCVGEERLHLISVSLEGPVSTWFNEEMESEPFKDWPEFKRRLVARFAPVQSFLLSKENMQKKWINQEAKSTPQSDLTKDQREMLKINSFCADVSLETDSSIQKSEGFGSVESMVAELIHEEDASVEHDLSLTTESLGIFETDMGIDVPRQVVSDVLIHKGDHESELWHTMDSPVVTSYSLSEAKLSNGSVSYSEDIPAELAQHNDSPIVVEVDEHVEIYQSLTNVMKSHYALHSLDILSSKKAYIRHKKKQNKCSKTWKFKYKPQNLPLRPYPEQLKVMKQRNMGLMREWVPFKHGFHENLKHDSNRLTQLLVRDGTLTVKHRGRYKQLETVSGFNTKHSYEIEFVSKSEKLQAVSVLRSMSFRCVTSVYLRYPMSQLTKSEIVTLQGRVALLSAHLLTVSLVIQSVLEMLMTLDSVVVQGQLNERKAYNMGKTEGWSLHTVAPYPVMYHVFVLVKVFFPPHTHKLRIGIMVVAGLYRRRIIQLHQVKRMFVTDDLTLLLWYEFKEGSSRNVEFDIVFKGELLLSQVQNSDIRPHYIRLNTTDLLRGDKAFSIGSLLMRVLVTGHAEHLFTPATTVTKATNKKEDMQLWVSNYKMQKSLMLYFGNARHPGQSFCLSKLEGKLCLCDGGIDTSTIPESLDMRRDVEFEEVVERIGKMQVYWEVLVQWQELPPHECSWLKASDFETQFPAYKLADKLRLLRPGIDMPQRLYDHKKKIELQLDKSAEWVD